MRESGSGAMSRATLLKVAGLAHLCKSESLMRGMTDHVRKHLEIEEKFGYFLQGQRAVKPRLLEVLLPGRMRASRDKTG